MARYRSNKGLDVSMSSARRVGTSDGEDVDRDAGAGSIVGKFGLVVSAGASFSSANTRVTDRARQQPTKPPDSLDDPFLSLVASVPLDLADRNLARLPHFPALVRRVSPEER
jgi:hypothetical protein